MMNKIVIFISAFFTWLFLNWSMDIQNIVAGLVIAAITTALTADLFVRNIGFFRRPLRYLWMLYYVPIFAWECVKANLVSAWHIVHPDVPIKPGIVKVKTELRSDTGLTFLANTLSLKPGTMTVDIDKEKGFLYVHWADVECQDVEGATKMISEKFEKILKRIFG